MGRKRRPDRAARLAPRAPAPPASEPSRSAAPSAKPGATPSRSFAQGVGFLHLGYLLALPLAGLVHVQRSAALGPVVTTAWIGIVVYAVFLVQGYRLDARPARALFVAAAVPGQLGALTWLTAGDVLAYLHEAAVVEVGVLLFGLAVAMLVARPSGLGGALLLVAVAAAWIPYSMPLVRAWPDWPLAAQALFASSVATSFQLLTRDLLGAAQRYNRTGRAQTVHLEFGSEDAPRGRALVRPIEGTARDVRGLVAIVVVVLVAAIGLRLAGHETRRRSDPSAAEGYGPARGLRVTEARG
ncbi:MAG: hypothetical protein FJ096_04810 [Deltaproteobacteria bacterium]|nr:hypothetical protein [Deltaproteobacteria bacterium]